MAKFIKVTKEPLVAEDIALGIGTVEQSRGTVTQLSGAVIPYSVTETINEAVDGKEAILDNDAKLALKADLNGDNTETFAVSDATAPTHAMPKNQVDIALASKADISYVDTEVALKSDETNTLLKDGTSPSFTPVSPNQPATKGYVDGLIIDVGAGDMQKSVYDTGDTGIVDSAEGLGAVAGPLGKSSSEQVMRLSQLNVTDCNILTEMGIWVGTDVANAPASGMIGLEQLSVSGTKAQRCYSFVTNNWYDREWNGTLWSPWEQVTKKSYVDSELALKLNLAGGTLTGALNVPAGATGTETPQVQEVATLAGDNTFTGNQEAPSMSIGGVDVVPGIVTKTSARNTIISSDGVLALATTPTPSFNTVIYTGNGTSQNIVTGLESTDPNWVSAGSYTLDQHIVYDYVIYKALTTHTGVATTPDADATNWLAIGTDVHIPFFNSAVDIKGRSLASSHIIVDTLRGEGERLFSDLTNIESLSGTSIQNFSSTGFSVGSGTSINTDLATYVAWQTQYDTMFYGVTNHGKKFVTAYNAQSGEFMIIGVGSGAIGHSFPHGIGTVPNLIMAKNRDSVVNWVGSREPNLILKLNTDDLEDTNTNNLTAWDDTSATFGLGSTSNELDSNMVFYGSSNRENHTVTKVYIGTGAAGNVVDLGLDMTQAGAKITIKALTVVASWYIKDNVRGTGQSLFADLANAEATTQAVQFTTTGIVLDELGSGTNVLGEQYLITAVVPNYDKPNGGLDVPAGNILSYAEGTDNTTGDLDTIEPTTQHSDIALLSGVKNYFYIDKGDTVGVTAYPLLKTADYVSADANSDTYDVAEGIMHLASTGTATSRVYIGEAIVDGGGEIIPGTLVANPVAHLDVASLEVHKDAVFHGKVRFSHSWRNVEPDRAIGATYTNNSGQFIMVNVQGRYISDGDVKLIVDGLTVGFAQQSAGSTNKWSTLTAMVPHGSTYLCTSLTNIGLNWFELRGD